MYVFEILFIVCNNSETWSPRTGCSFSQYVVLTWRQFENRHLRVSSSAWI
jgi:hypothetical protein